jgi:putative transposase
MPDFPDAIDFIVFLPNTFDFRTQNHISFGAIRPKRSALRRTYPKGVACLIRDQEAMLAFFDFPAEHWGHLRTSNPIESVFATVRHRTVRTKGALSQKTAKLMVFTLIQAPSKKWLRLKGRNQLPKVIEGIKFNDGVEVTTDTKNRAA